MYIGPAFNALGFGAAAGSIKHLEMFMEIMGIWSKKQTIEVKDTKTAAELRESLKTMIAGARTPMNESDDIQVVEDYEEMEGEDLL